ncbi:MAG: YibE/F family protein [Acidimicrobiales bacterium]|nr:YibE/F family protein [Acidimicrobiales bacterium]
MSGHHAAHASTDARLRRGLTVGVALVAVLAVAAMAWLWPRGEAPELNPGGATLEFVDATVTSVRVDDCLSIEVVGAATECQFVAVELTSGERSGGATFTIQASDLSKPDLAAGDEVVLARNPQAPEEFQYSYVDKQRDVPLLLLGALFAAAVVAFAGWKGARALLGIGVALAVIMVFLLPSLLRGDPALPVALAATVVIAFAVLYLAHGLNPSSTVALVGTLVSLAVTAVLAQVFVGMAGFTGLLGDEAITLSITAEVIDLRALLVAGIVIGALGVLDDVTVTQVSTVVELRRTSPDLTRRALYRSAVRVGRDHIASVVNTLVLAYAGASLPLLLVFLQGNRPWERALTSELVAVEIVRTLVGSIGLVLAVPLTTALAALVIAEADPAVGDHEAIDLGPIDLGPFDTGSATDPAVER